MGSEKQRIFDYSEDFYKQMTEEEFQEDVKFDNSDISIEDVVFRPYPKPIGKEFS